LHLSAGAFYDFGNFSDCAALDSTTSGIQYISPNLTFPCPGVVTKWKIGAFARGALFLQIWRPDGMSYSRVNQSVYFETTGEPVEVFTNMSVLAGDVIGFWTRRLSQFELSIAPVPDYTLLQGSQSGFVVFTPSETFHQSDVSSTVVGASPLVTVSYGNAYSQHLMQSYAQIQCNEMLLFSRPLCVFLHRHSTFSS